MAKPSTDNAYFAQQNIKNNDDLNNRNMQISILAINKKALLLCLNKLPYLIVDILKLGMFENYNI